MFYVVLGRTEYIDHIWGYAVSAPLELEVNIATSLLLNYLLSHPSL